MPSSLLPTSWVLNDSDRGFGGWCAYLVSLLSVAPGRSPTPLYVGIEQRGRLRRVNADGDQTQSSVYVAKAII
jgi:hypothetical protein